MINKHIQAGAATVALLFALAPLAHAAIDVKGAVDVDMDTKMEMGTVNANTGVRTESKMEMHEEDDGRVKIETESETHMMGEGEMMEGDEHETGMDRAQEEADEHALDVLGEVELRLDLRKGGEEHAAGTAEVDTAAKVKSEHDLEDFMHHKAKADAHLKGVEIKDGKVEVKYAQPAKLFGFMKTTIDARASVDAKDTIEVEYPWYHIFMKKHVSKASMQSSIARALAAQRIAVKNGIATTTIQTDVAASIGVPNIFEIIANELQSVRVKAETEVEAD